MDNFQAKLDHLFRDLESLTDIDQFFDRVQAFSSLGKTDSAIDEIFDFIDRLLCDGSFSDVDKVLDKVDLDKISLDIALSFLTITMAAKTKLLSRAAFFDKIHAKLLLEDEKKAKRILDRLG